MRKFANITLRSLRPFFSAKLPTQPLIRYDFAKISKKDEQKIQKKKEKTRAKEELGGDISEIDLNKFDESYSAVIVAFKEQISTIRAGRLQVATLNKVLIKLGNEHMALNSLAQISSKGANSCAISPFDSDQLEIIQKSLKVWDDSLQIKRQQKSLLLTQLAQGKEVKDKLVQKLKKLTADRKEELKRLRSNTADELKKYKKLIPEDRLKTIETEAKTLFDKRNQQIEKLQKEKEKQLLK